MCLSEKIKKISSLCDQLDCIDGSLDNILKEKIGASWIFTKTEDEQKFLTKIQCDWRALKYYFEAALINSGDIFRYLPIIYTKADAFALIGATKTLEAAAELKKYYDIYTQLTTRKEQYAYWDGIKEQIVPIEDKAEDVEEFADLMIRYAAENPTEFPV